MGSMPLALSVHNFITSVGADAGFASIIGLAILVLLYFAHAKETSNLHEEAEELAHRLLEAETRLAQLSRQQPAPAPAPGAVAPAPASQAARSAAAPPIRAGLAGAAAIAVPAAPVGVGAPALASATRMIPAVSAEPDPDHDLAPADVPGVDEQAEPAVPAGAEQIAAAQGARAAAASAPVKERPAGPTPATAAGAANGGNGERRVAAPVGVGAPPESPPRPRVQIRSGAPAAAGRRPALPPRSPAPRRSGAGRRFVLLVGALIAVAAIAALVIITATGGGSSSSRSRSAATTNAPGPSRRGTPPAFTPSSVTVAVLNGTATNDLAHRVAAKLTSGGYKQGNVFTASNQTQAATVVAYLPGFRNDALHVATALKLGPASVQAIDQSSQAVACPQPAPCTANVVVTVGADLATL
jgi:hypothetical protein